MFLSKFKRVIGIYKSTFFSWKKQLGILALLGFLSGLLEGIGVTALIPLFSFVTGDGSTGTDFISTIIEKIFRPFNVEFGVEYLLIFISALFIFKAVVLYIGNYIQVKISTDYERQTRSELLNNVLQSNWPYLLKQKLGNLETVLMKEIRKASTLLQTIGNSVLVFTNLFVYLFIAGMISLRITLLTILLGIGLLFIFIPLLKRMRAITTETVNYNKNIAHFINENIIGMKTVKALSVATAVLEMGKEHFIALQRLRIRNTLLSSIPVVSVQPIVVIFVLVVFAFSYKMPGFNAAAFLVIMYLIQRIFNYIQQLQTSVQRINEGIPYLESIRRNKRHAERNKESNEGGGNFAFENKLEFRNVFFSYGKDKEVLKNINFKIRKGEFIGLVGPSGVGKTTVVDLILRLFEPTKGEILLDKKDAREVTLDSWRKNIGYISQDIYLTNNTIADNIAFYNPSLTESDIKEVAQMANIYDFIEALPQKFETMVGERGIMLSAGQRQRISIARVLARKPQFLVLDEATSALDNESEAQIQKVIENLKGEVTVLVVAHRLSTVMSCDNLLILEGGGIIEQGNPKELLKNKNSYFYKVYNIRE